jgi:hypothetical protein
MFFVLEQVQVSEQEQHNSKLVREMAFRMIENEEFSRCIGVSSSFHTAQKCLQLRLATLSMTNHGHDIRAFYGNSIVFNIGRNVYS